MSDWVSLQEKVIDCERCPRLRAHCAEEARKKVKRFRDWDYWGRPVPTFGLPQARLLLVGLAPAAHGANRTGRMFTGDRSGDFLYDALHRCGFASQPTATDLNDGLELIDCAITAAVRCAPPQNKPTTGEQNNCFPYLVETVRLMPNLRGFLCLGQLGFKATLKVYRALGWPVPRPQPKFGHGVMMAVDGAPFIANTYHPSQQNTFTGTLTMEMLCAVLEDVRARLRSPAGV